MTGRRQILFTLGAIACGAPLAPYAQQAQAPAGIRRIGLLSTESPSETTRLHQAFQLGLRDLGWVEGKNLSMEYRHAEGRSDRLADLAADLVRLKVDVIVASVLADALAAHKATKAIPIVVASGSDPVAGGLAESLARPGGNVTGLTLMAPELAGKRLELLKEMVPKLSRVAVLWNPEGVGSQLNWKELQAPARRLGVQLQSVEVRSPGELDKAFDEASRAGAGALFVIAHAMIGSNLERIARLATKSRLPSMFHRSEFADAGGLVTYGVDRADLYRRAATYVNKIFKGARPGDLPIERATKFELVINLKTAKAIGLTVPRDLLFRADRVIE